MGVIDIIGVDPDYQRRGVSSRLTEFATEHMRSRGMDIAVIETGGDPGHAPARAAYETRRVHAPTHRALFSPAGLIGPPVTLPNTLSRSRSQARAVSQHYFVVIFSVTRFLLGR